MLPSELPTLPKWASYRTFGADDPRGPEGEVMFTGQAVQVEVDADAAYPAVLDEYFKLYERVEDRPDFVRAADWPEVWDELTPDDPDVLSAYWLEVVYQTIKMDVQRVTGFALNLHIKHADPEVKERFRQATSPDGRLGAKKAASSGPKGGRDARHHYKKLRGFLVA